MNKIVTLEIVRIEQTDEGTLGLIRRDNKIIGCTYELPWNNNTPNLSCIPEGKYMCKRYKSEKYGKTFKVLDVDNRTDILFHRGNCKEDTKGCILIGEYFGTLLGMRAVLNSKYAFANFKEELEDVKDYFYLDIISV